MSRTRIVVAVAVAAVIAVGGLVALGASAEGDFARIRGQVDDDGEWETATKAAENLAGAADVLRSLAEDEGCTSDPAPASRCAGLLRSAGWAQVSAVGALRCTQPYVVDIRRDLANLLDALADGGPGLASPPPVPRC